MVRLKPSPTATQHLDEGEGGGEEMCQEVEQIYLRRGNVFDSG